VDATALWLKNPIFATAGNKACAMLAERYPAKRHRAGAQIVASGALVEHLHVLLDGCVRVYHQNPDGLEVTVKLLRTPCVYGDIELFHDLPFLERVAAVDDSLIARIPRAEYEAFLRANPWTMFEHLRHLSAAFCVSARNEQQLFASLERRIANLLLAYAQIAQTTARRASAPGFRPAVPLTQESIAQSLGVVRRSVAGVLAKWNKEGILRKRGDEIVLERLEFLEQLCAPIASSLPYWIGMPLDKLAVLADDEPEAAVEVVSGPDEVLGKIARIGRELIVGTDASCGLVLPGASVAPLHCRFFRSARGGRYWVQSLTRKARTFHAGEPITRAVLREGDAVGIGDIELRMRLGQEK
jgi:CRP-like cAMP-binding protein